MQGKVLRREKSQAKISNTTGQQLRSTQVTMQLKTVRSIWQSSKHNAFTDLIAFNHNLLCCFREANTHISGDGVIRIVTLDATGNQIWRERISVAGADLRDPKLLKLPNGDLMLIAYARFADQHNRTRWTRSLVWRSNTGKSWSQPRYFGPSYWWIWRLHWVGNTAFGLAYNRTEQRLDLYSGNPFGTFELHQANVLGLVKHQLGYPNESDLLLTDQNTLIALVRRDADSCTAQLGVAKPPYKKWQWHDLGTYFGSPVIKTCNNGELLVAGRQWLNRQPKTVVAKLSLATLTNPILHSKVVLPSAGDNAYPGLVIKENSAIVSYYSQHENRRCQIYLAEIDL